MEKINPQNILFIILLNTIIRAPHNQPENIPIEGTTKQKSKKAAPRILHIKKA
jgi:hypothetical protein